jgi:hypothetical protein
MQPNGICCKVRHVAACRHAVNDEARERCRGIGVLCRPIRFVARDGRCSSDHPRDRPMLMTVASARTWHPRTGA